MDFDDRENNDLHTIEAERFVLRDKHGIVRAQLTTDSESNAIFCRFEGDKPKLMLSAGSAAIGPSLVMVDQNGVNRLAVTIKEGGIEDDSGPFSAESESCRGNGGKDSVGATV